MSSRSRSSDSSTLDHEGSQDDNHSEAASIARGPGQEIHSNEEVQSDQRTVFERWRDILQFWSPFPTIGDESKRQLMLLSREESLETLTRLFVGLGSGHKAAKTNEKGCILTQQFKGRDKFKFVKIRPVLHAGGKLARHISSGELPETQLAHHLAVIAFKRHVRAPHTLLPPSPISFTIAESETKYSPEEIKRLHDGECANHLCHQMQCINPTHLIVEDQEVAIERQVYCDNAIQEFELDGKRYWILQSGECICPGQKCIPMIRPMTVEEHEIQDMREFIIQRANPTGPTDFTIVEVNGDNPFIERPLSDTEQRLLFMGSST